MFAKVAVLARISLTNIFSSLLNLFVGLVLLFGAALLVIGGSVFTTLDEALSKSIVGSITGHLQVYGAGSKDPLEVYGRVDGSDSSLSPIDDFKSLKAKLLEVENVERVVPMGAATAMLGAGNTVDLTLEKLRALHRNQLEPATRLPPEEFERQSHSKESHVRNIVSVLSKDLERAKELSAASVEPEAVAAVEKASSEAFWTSFDDDPFGHLELLENHIAPLVSDADMLFIRYLGTDLDAYQATFDRMTIVEGTKVPSGHRGILLPRFFVEEALKLKNARRLDKIKDALAAGRRLADSTDKELLRLVRENQAQTREIVLQLDAIATATAVEKLQTLLGKTDSDLAVLLSRFFGVTDENFEERFQFFYRELAPMLSMYRARVGDDMTLRSFGRSGSAQTALVKVYGIFELRGLEKSPLAGANSLVDLVTFRELYGYLSAEGRAELEAMKAASAVKEISRTDVEADLFGGDSELVQDVEMKKVDVDVEAAPRRSGGGGDQRTKVKNDTFSVEQLDDGIVLNAALWLKDGSAAAQAKTFAEIERLLGADAPPPDAARIATAKALAAGGALPSSLAQALSTVVGMEEARAKDGSTTATASLLALKDALKAERAVLTVEQRAVVEELLTSAKPKVWVVGWGSAAGFLGKFIDFFRLLLGAIVVAFAFIALIVVTIGMTIATLQRTATIGTMRAIGAQRSFVTAMVLGETALLAVFFGSLGAAVGAACVKYLHHRGIPAFRDELYFFFSGPVLRPELTMAGVVSAVITMVVVSLLAVLFPVYLATRVAPITAMQSAD
jgi:ABC-type lipoprotein release transport system permease subunit